MGIVNNLSESLKESLRRKTRKKQHESQGRFKRVPGKWLSLPENDPGIIEGIKHQPSHAIVVNGKVVVAKRSGADEAPSWSTMKKEKIECSEATHIYEMDSSKPIQCLDTLQNDFILTNVTFYNI